MRNSNSTTRPSRPPSIAFVDERGRPCLRVPLDRCGEAYATVLSQDYERVQDLGATETWHLNANSEGQHYVRTNVFDDKGGRTKVQVARIIAGAGPKSTIFYVNKDRLDLRPENLFWHRNGKSRQTTVELVKRGAELRRGRAAALNERSEA